MTPPPSPDLSNFGDLEDDGVYSFIDEVEAGPCREAIRWVLGHNIRPQHDLLTMLVCSEGGSVGHGFALIDVIVGSRIPVRTIGLGVIASMGLMLFIAGAKGKRILTPNTLVLSHQFSGANMGKEHELLAGQRGNEIVAEAIVAHYRRHTGLSEKKVRQWLLPPNDVWLTAPEALELGLCDEVRDLG